MTILLPTSPPLPGATAVLDFNNAIKALKGNTQTAFNAAATVDIGSTDTVNILINGNTAITSFGANANLMQDEFRFVRFSGTPLITHNGTSLICPNGTSIPVKANDAALLQYLGSGNWRVYAYFPATSGSRLALTADTTFYVRTAPAAISFTNGSPNIGWTGHGLALNDPVVIDVLPFPTYVTISNASPAVVTYTAHGFAAGQPIRFDSAGYLPPGIVPGTTYYVLATGLTANTFQFSATVGGAAVNTTKLTFTAANDGSGNLQFTATAHGLVAGNLISFANSGGSLPGGISAATAYYVVATGLAANTFEVSTTATGSPVAFASTGSGTNTLEQVGGSTAVNFGASATHRCHRTGAMPTFSIAGLLVAGTVYFVGTIVDGNTITLSTTTGNANPIGTATVATGSPQYTAVTGNDANGGLAQTRSGALLTLQAAMNLVAGSYDFQAKNVTIQCGSSTYNTGANITPWTGGGTLTFQGDATYFANVPVIVSSNGLTQNCSFIAQSGALPGLVTINGFKVNTIGAGSGISCRTPSALFPTNIEFGPCNGNHLQILSGGSIIYAGNYVASGNAVRHIQFNGVASIGNATSASINAASTIVIIAGVSLSWIVGTDGYSQLVNSTFIGSSIGKKFDLFLNSVVNSGGQGINYYPGNVAGTNVTGSQYA